MIEVRCDECKAPGVDKYCTACNMDLCSVCADLIVCPVDTDHKVIDVRVERVVDR